ncbi:unnamed protein product [Orchesella dallaii]|uniref:F-box domain-containing protein n=1 Tax=Orchesella dallaii TaxID=48710 RepID=A0ABP1R4J4_9HEXA
MCILVLRIILSYIPSQNKKDMLCCRLVNKRWLGIIDEPAQKAITTAYVTPFPEVCKCQLVSNLSAHEDIGEITPFKGLLITSHCKTGPDEGKCDGEDEAMLVPSPAMWHGLGEHLTSLALHDLYFDFMDLRILLNLLPSMEIFYLSQLQITTKMANRSLSFPALPRLKNLVRLDLCGDYFQDEQ